MITSGHNPEWNGVKYKASYGGTGSPKIIASIESYLLKQLAAAATVAKIEEVDFAPTHITALGEVCWPEEDQGIGLSVFD